MVGISWPKHAAALLLAQCAIWPAALAAQEASYGDAIRCSAYYTVLGTIIEEDDPDGAEALADAATRWMVMALTRDNRPEGAAEGELDAAAQSLVERLAAAVGDEAELDRLFDVESGHCMALEMANAEEYTGIVLEE